MEQMETAQRLADCSFAVNGAPFWGKLKARELHLPGFDRLIDPRNASIAAISLDEVDLRNSNSPMRWVWRFPHGS